MQLQHSWYKLCKLGFNFPYFLTKSLEDVSSQYLTKLINKKLLCIRFDLISICWQKKIIEDANVTLHIELIQGSSMSLPIESMHNCNIQIGWYSNSSCIKKAYSQREIQGPSPHLPPPPRFISEIFHPQQIPELARTWRNIRQGSLALPFTGNSGRLFLTQTQTEKPMNRLGYYIAVDQPAVCFQSDAGPQRHLQSTPALLGRQSLFATSYRTTLSFIYLYRMYSTLTIAQA